MWIILASQNTDNKDLASALQKDPDTWNKFDNAQMQRVPLMIHMPGYTQRVRSITNTVERNRCFADITLHLWESMIKIIFIWYRLSISSSARSSSCFRNGNWTPKYTVLGGKAYNNQTGEIIDTKAAGIDEEISKDQGKVKTALSLSDK